MLALDGASWDVPAHHARTDAEAWCPEGVEKALGAEVGDIEERDW